MSDTIDLIQEVEQSFSSTGPLANHWTGYVPREGQIEMALAVANQIQTGGSLVVQAGTGVGKTFAYLNPSHGANLGSGVAARSRIGGDASPR